MGQPKQPNPQSLPVTSAPPPPPYDTPQSPPPVSAVMTTSNLAGIQFGPDAQAMTCPYCRVQIITKVKSKASTKTHLIALLLCCCICWFCAWMPYVMDSCQNRNHYCPNCRAYLGTYEN